MADDMPKKRPLNIEKLRDEIAQAALLVVMERCGPAEMLPGETMAQMFARRSYEVADAMMVEREK